MLNFTRTKIIATLGPSSETIEKITELVKSGVTMFRLNTSHETPEYHARLLKKIRDVEIDLNTQIPVMVDLQGPKIRVGKFETPIELKKGDILKFRHQEKITPDGVLPVDYEDIAKDVKPSDKIFLDDGKLQFKVLEVNEDTITTEALNDGILKQRKGINIPGNTGSINVLTERDKEFVRFAIENNVDYIALSFVRDANDVMELKNCIKEHGGKIKIISKIEKPQAVKNADDIINKSAGILIARGDLGIEISTEKVPVVQKELTKKANIQRKLVILATQMLESMIENPIPTRAETSDVANAILDGVDALLLSGETAAGKYPVEAINTMKIIADNVENSDIMQYNKYSKEILEYVNDDSTAICSAVIEIVDKIKPKAILTISASGYTTKLLSKARPNIPIFVCCPSVKNCRRLKLFRDVYPIDLNVEITTNSLNQFSEYFINKLGMKKGDKIVLTGAVPDLLVGKTNFIKVHEL